MYTSTTAQMMTTQNTAVFTFELMNSPFCRPARAAGDGSSRNAQRTYMKDVEFPAFDSRTFAFQIATHLRLRSEDEPARGSDRLRQIAERPRTARTHDNFLAGNNDGPMFSTPERYLMFLEEGFDFNVASLSSELQLSPGCQFRTARSPVEAARQIASESRNASSPSQLDPLSTVAQKGDVFLQSATDNDARAETEAGAYSELHRTGSCAPALSTSGPPEASGRRSGSHRRPVYSPGRGHAGCRQSPGPHRRDGGRWTASDPFAQQIACRMTRRLTARWQSAKRSMSITGPSAVEVAIRR